MINLLKDLVREQKELRALVDKTKPQIKTLPPDCPLLPIQTVENFKTFNKYLKDEENFSKMVSIVYTCDNILRSHALRVGGRSSHIFNEIKISPSFIYNSKSFLPGKILIL